MNGDNSIPPKILELAQIYAAGPTSEMMHCQGSGPRVWLQHHVQLRVIREQSRIWPKMLSGVHWEAAAALVGKISLGQIILSRKHETNSTMLNARLITLLTALKI